MITKDTSKNKGFTLVEFLIVIAVIAILAAVVYIVIDTTSRMKDANDAERWSNVTEILSAITKYSSEHKDQLPNATAWTVGNYYVLGTGADCKDTCAAQPNVLSCLKLTDLAATLEMIPLDPKSGAAVNTGYYVYRSATTNVITVGACAPENATVISVAR